MQPILEMKNISKSFIGVKAVDDVSLHCMPGEVHVLVGENGAGKSTILKILAGLYTADSGTIVLKGNQVKFKHTWEARKAGIAMLYQELTILPGLTVAQNVFLNEEKSNAMRKSGLIDEKAMREQVIGLSEKYGIDVNPYALAGDLPIAKQQMVEILKVLVRDPEIIIFDEPTSALAREEVDKLYEIIKILQKDGKTIIFISHRLEEVLRFGERATVLKDGKFVATVDLKGLSEADIVKLMIGRELKDIFPQKNVCDSDEVLFSVEGINVPGILHDIAFDVKNGEVLGIAGLQGQGQTELMRVISGVMQKSSGKIFIHDEEVKIGSVSSAIKAGIAYIPEDRKIMGLMIELSVRDNLTISSLKQRQRFGVIKGKLEKSFVKETVDSLNIKTPSPDQYVIRLSGGNQQKIVLGKVLSIKPKVMLINEPTRGVDVKTKQEFYRLMRKFAEEGVAVIMYSSDLLEIVGVSDRVLTMYEGRITSELLKNEISEEAIMMGATGIKEIGGRA